ncbi:efflux RND transporter periplasmic adaptor subunit [Rhodocytophaga rosea]|uniref:Efflux RND transporter periplasmic adaptor subunit n=1 Tax=Rhodocytophaga rosea TaxID=2704465 RepID=A0A6C0GFL0_9BACT|nr:efflux RND transporter periplasmic adaptor subunit [Rhodocytophaga rosea]QHT66542.1 efflux RND transporter periplasmic adaptor subunit [Rhodocytophaga rosea]
MKFQNYIQLYISVLLLVLSLSFSSCSANEPAEEATQTDTSSSEEKTNIVSLTQAQYQNAGITLGNIESRSLSSNIQVNGVLDVPPQNLVSISTPLGGFVRKTDLLQGMRVRKGQLLAVIENQDFIQLQQDYLESKSKLEYLDLEYKRQQELSQENVSAAKTFQQTTADYKSMQAKVHALEERMRLAGLSLSAVQQGKISSTVPVYAPISGYVADVNVNIGKFVQPTDVMFTIIDTEHLHVELTVFEKDVPSLKEGQKVRYILVNDPSKERTAEVYLIGRQISAERTVRVHAHKDTEEPQMLPGMFVKAVIETGGRQVSSLPQEAVVHTNGKDYIFIYQQAQKQGSDTLHVFEQVEVTKGLQENEYVEVNSVENMPLQGKQIVTKGAFSLLSHLQNGGSAEGEHEL